MSEKTSGNGKPDWELIEQRYCAGILSLREIAKLDGNVSEGAIRKRAKANGWERDLNAKIQKKADGIVRRREVRTKVRSETALTERVLIEAGAEIIAEVKQSHRTDIARCRYLVVMMLEELELTSINHDLLLGIRELLSDGDTEGRNEKLNDLLLKVISLPSRIDSVRKLSEALRVLIDKEREAYNMDVEDKKQAASIRDPLSMLLHEIQGSTFPVVVLPGNDDQDDND